MQTFRRTNATDAGGDYHVDELHNQVVYPFDASGRLASLASVERRHRSVECEYTFLLASLADAAGDYGIPRESIQLAY